MTIAQQIINIIIFKQYDSSGWTNMNIYLLLPLKLLRTALQEDFNHSGLAMSAIAVTRESYSLLQDDQDAQSPA